MASRAALEKIYYKSVKLRTYRGGKIAERLIGKDSRQTMLQVIHKERKLMQNILILKKALSSLSASILGSIESPLMGRIS
jgi:hypothetical protein